MPTFYTTIQMTNDELSNALKSLLPGPDKTTQLFGSTNGANVVLCTDQGYKVSLHEVLIRRFTTLLNGFDSTSIEELRDPFGSLVIVLQDVDKETLQALAQLLYTGECIIQSEEGKETLTEILALGVTSELSCSPDVQPSSQSSHEYQPQTEQDKTGEQDDPLQSETMRVFSDPDISEKEMGNNYTEVTDLANKDIDTTYGTLEFEEAIEVLCNDIGSESPLKSAEDAEDKIESEGKNHFDDGDVEESEKESKVNTSDKDNLMENCELPSKQKSKKKSGVYHCEICNKVFTQKGGLNRHLRSHTGEKRFKCSHCDKEFANKFEVTPHERIHTGEKPYKCSYCDRKFAHQRTVIRHVLTHTGEKPFRCSYCNKQFARKYDITRHEETHKEKPFN